MKIKHSQQIRIIAGRWRGSKLAVPDVVGLRPTPDRVRETLFNWIATKCPRSNVLDCFAGTGALGFEALSREAGHISLIELDKQACANLQLQITRFETDRVSIIKGDVISVIPELKRQYDVVFIDPPYALPQLRVDVLHTLVKNNKLNNNAVIYLEWPNAQAPELPGDFKWLKQKKAGQVHYAIAEWQGRR